MFPAASVNLDLMNSSCRQPKRKTQLRTRETKSTTSSLLAPEILAKRNIIFLQRDCRLTMYVAQHVYWPTIINNLHGNLWLRGMVSRFALWFLFNLITSKFSTEKLNVSDQGRDHCNDEHPHQDGRHINPGLAWNLKPKYRDRQAHKNK